MTGTKNKARMLFSNQLIVVLILLTTLGCNNKNAPLVKIDKSPPNVLFIAVDDLNTMLSSYGGPAKTPNFDRLAAMGVQFNDAHCQAPLCGPSRASVMTGLRPSTTGIYGMIPDNKIISDNPDTKDITFMPEYFSEHGFYTMGVGKLFHNHAPDGLFDESGGRVEGFGPYPEERFVWDGFGTSDRKSYGRTSTDWGAFPEADSLMPDHQSVNWAIERLNKSYDTPFFLGVGFLRVHVPLYVPQKWFDLYPLDSINTMPYLKDDLNDVPAVAHKINDLPMMPSTEWAITSGEWLKIIQAYLACISYVDYELGRLLDALENSMHADNTVIVLWSDHGYRLGEKGTFAKHALWDVATKVPMFFAGPNVPKGEVVETPAELLDIYPTLLDLCNLPPYPRNEGKSLLPVMNGEDDAHKVAITTFGKNNHAIKSSRFRYIQYEDQGEELYDHKTDQNEFHNLALEADYHEIISNLKQHLPETNASWHEHSQYTFQPYFVAQKARLNSPQTKN